MPFAIRIDVNTIPALVFGGLLIVVAVVMGVLVWRARRAMEPMLENDDQARLHADRQFRRRMQVSIALGGIGILIPVGDQLDQVFVNRPLLFIAWVGFVLLLAMWMVLMALGDWLSTVAYSAVAKSRLRYERRILEDEIRRYHASRDRQSMDEIEDSN